MHRGRVVNSCLNSRVQQGGLECIPIVCPKRVEMINVPRPRHLGRPNDISACQVFVICLHNGTPSFSPAFEMAQLDAQNRALKTFHTVVVSVQ
jgi:hypothetical protein